MFKNKTIKNQVISVLLLITYCFSSFSISLFHDHDHDHDHNHDHNDQDVLYCENVSANSDFQSNCTNHQHLIELKEKCFICDHVFNLDPSITQEKIKQNIVFFYMENRSLYVAPCVYNRTTLLNKSPPFLV